MQFTKIIYLCRPNQCSSFCLFLALWSFCAWPTLCRGEGGCFIWGWDIKKFQKQMVKCPYCFATDCSSLKRTGNTLIKKKMHSLFQQWLSWECQSTSVWFPCPESSPHNWKLPGSFLSQPMYAALNVNFNFEKAQVNNTWKNRYL